MRSFGSLWAILGHLWAILGPPLGTIGHPLDHLGQPWASLGSPLGIIGQPLGHPWASLGPTLGPPLGSIWDPKWCKSRSWRIPVTSHETLLFAAFGACGPPSGAPNDPLGAYLGPWWALLGACGRHRGSKCRFGAPFGDPRCPQAPLFRGRCWSRSVNVGQCKRFAAEAGPAEGGEASPPSYA